LTTEEILADMLCESTPRVLVDSSILGRSDEHNQKMVKASGLKPHEAFLKAKDATLSFAYGYIDLTVSTFHFLRNNLLYDEKVAEFFNAFEYLCWVKANGINEWAKEFSKVMRCARTVGLKTVRWMNKYIEENHNDYDMWNRGCPWYDCLTVQKFCSYLMFLGHGVGGIYGEGEPCGFYTYNEENILSQDFKCWYFEVERPDDYEEYNHLCKGCGYEWSSDRENDRFGDAVCPKCDGVYTHDEPVELPIEIDGAFAIIEIHNGADARWGFTRPVIFEVNGPSELGVFDYGRGGIGCTNCEFRNYLDGGYWDGDEYDKIDEMEIVKLEHAVEAPAPISEGKLFVDEDGNGYCPVCGHRLEGYSY
jgi:hypothetical protein